LRNDARPSDDIRRALARPHAAATVGHPAQFCVDQMQFSKSGYLARVADVEMGR